MKFFLQRHKHFLILSFIFLVAEIITNPLGDFPLNDDWSYGQTLKIYYAHGEIFLGNFPAMTLCTQILWGFLFTKLFGFSFFVLRCSTLFATLVGFAFLNKLILQISHKKNLALLSCLVLMFSPMIFNLTNSYMTDVNFNTLVIMCCYFSYNFLRTKNIVSYVFFIVFATALVFLRQYGMIVPACLIAASLFVKEKKARTILLSLVAFGIVTVLLKLYEDYLSHLLPEGSAYKFSGNIHITERIFWDNFFSNFALRRREIIIHLLAYPMPFAIIFLVRLVKRFKVWQILIMLLADVALIYLLFTSGGFSSPSTFMNTMLGNESFHESWTMHHNESLAFDNVLMIIKCISSFITLFVILLGLTGIATKQHWKQAALQPEVIFLALLICAYTFMILITESYFDRYHIPMITLMIILLAYLGKACEPKFAFAVIPLLFWAYISVAGTKDYLQWNRTKWEAYWYLRRDLKVPADKINGGGEINGWNEGNGWGWRDYFILENFNYLIQFDLEKDFVVPLKAYEFQRYLPYKKDKIYIFVRQDQKNSKHHDQ